MVTCELCEKDLPIASLGGHLSGHSRRGDVFSRRREKKTHFECEECKQTFSNGSQLLGHKRKVHTAFELIKSIGGRRRRLLHDRGNQCEVCQLTEWQNSTIPIEVDHIDGNPENNTLGNLRLICPNCHAQTDTFRGKNVGKVANSKRKQVMRRYYRKYR